MENLIQFDRTSNRVVLAIDGVTIEPTESLSVRNHSPTGFEFGYAGSGPAQASLAILLHVLGRRNADEMWPGGDAERLYQDFKFSYVGTLAHSAPHAEFRLDITKWADRQLALRARRR